MPTYPYACTACGHAFEVQQSFSDPSLTECPECSGRLRKVFSSVGVVFKGSGFYRTDSRSGSGKESSTESGKATGTSAGAGAESKPGGSSGAATGTTGSVSGSSTTKPAATTGSAPAAAAG